MASIFGAIYMTWRTWRHFLVLFTTLGDRACYFCCYLLHLVNMDFVFAAIYYGLRATCFQTFQNHCKNCHIIDFSMFLGPSEVIDFIAYSNEINDFGHIPKHEKTEFVTGFSMVLLNLKQSRFEIIVNSRNFENPRHQVV
jgi:hypothetical protein